MNNIEVGSLVKIVNPGEMYTTYTQWFKKYDIKFEYVARYAYDRSMSLPEEKDNVWEVLAKGEHEYGSGMLYLIGHSSYYGPVYLINESGIEPYVTKEEIKTRIKAVKAMEYLARQINDEDVFYEWLSLGVADGDIDFGDLSEESNGDVEFYVEDDERFAELMDVFLKCMTNARKSGGLYCGKVLSKEAK